MDASISAIEFDRHYDLAKLQNDLAAADEQARWMDKYSKGGRYDRWSAIPLYTYDGEIGRRQVEQHVSLRKAGRDSYLPTPILDHCPYVNEIIESFDAPKLRIRFMRLAAGGKIGLHFDKAYAYGKNSVRLHIPVITNKDVFFELNGNRLRLQAGCLWYVDTSKEHQVHNPSSEDRIHLVMDFGFNEKLQNFFESADWSTRYY